MSAVVKLRDFASYSIRSTLETPPPSSEAQMNAAVARLRDGATAFARLPLNRRITLARTMQQGYLRVAERMVHAGYAANGIAPGTRAEAEEWSTSP